jgi:phage-related protein
MSDIAKGCCELRIQDRDATWRIVCGVEEDAVLILAVFSKKTASTPNAVMDSCRERLRRYRAASED